ncbi:2-oxoisovalerate dehydrogenase subunitmitochondrial-like [Oopsacas minuta]|uniref:2-oxoisovalerate dehydrogenase subunit alpha n=1 Tax=Oopsacas minuta TaxID=111878 RepID=A0AAV7K348_9METZ|nr:2-oxoisovalerate dehydrogenase subunitmitochondrial-like [Oopsacas minuta]
MSRFLVNHLSAMSRLCRVTVLRPLLTPSTTQVRFQTTDIKHRDRLIQKELGIARYVGMKTVYSADIETCTVVPNHTPLPVYQVLDNEGCVHDTDQLSLSNQEVLDIYKQMVTLTLMDKLLYDAQRHGRISFYMACTGEEAIHFGSSAGLSHEDMVYAQYREAGVLMYRGFSPEECMNQCTGNVLDLGKARQMPVHYGSRKLNYQHISSPLGTQIPQAPGTAYAFKLQGANKCVCVFFGDGSASEGDCHAAMNFATTLQCPVLFFCRNNGYAISTPATEQYAGDGIAMRAIGYGMEAVRVDGNDLFAVYNAVKHYRERAVTENAPFLIEAMTYRVGHHSTSDDWKAYRYENEVHELGLNSCPVKRVKLFLIKQGLWTSEEDEDFIQQTRSTLIQTLEKAERQPKPGLDSLFTDVYDKIPSNLIDQRNEITNHIRKYPNEYPKHYQ